MSQIFGTVIHATLRNEDLIPAFADTLRTLAQDPTLPRSTRRSYNALCDVAAAFEAWDSDEASELACELSDALNDLAPAGHYFGSHPGDGADFGFWEIAD